MADGICATVADDIIIDDTCIADDDHNVSVAELLDLAETVDLDEYAQLLSEEPSTKLDPRELEITEVKRGALGGAGCKQKQPRRRTAQAVAERQAEAQRKTQARDVASDVFFCSQRGDAIWNTRVMHCAHTNARIHPRRCTHLMC